MALFVYISDDMQYNERWKIWIWFSFSFIIYVICIWKAQTLCILLAFVCYVVSCAHKYLYITMWYYIVVVGVLCDINFAFCHMQYKYEYILRGVFYLYGYTRSRRYVRLLNGAQALWCCRCFVCIVQQRRRLCISCEQFKSKHFLRSLIKKIKLN